MDRLGLETKEQKLSRSKIELFIDCARCFYLDRRLGIRRPPGFPFNLNIAVDQLLKNEFDGFRKEGKPHPVMEAFQIEAIPFFHPELNVWRENFQGIRHYHDATHFTVTGAIDDVWQRKDGKLIIVDYKATSKKDRLDKISQVHGAYKRQMDIYRWLFAQNGFEMAPEGYFVYCNGIKNKPNFNRHIEFEVFPIRYEGSDEWVEPTLFDIYECLDKAETPPASEACPYCTFAQKAKPYI